MRYVELNPVRAHLAPTAWEWPWSSALAHSMDRALDPVLDHRWAEHFGEWNYVEWEEMLAAGVPECECESFRRATERGEPLGSREFVEGLEVVTGRRLTVRSRGRPRKMVTDTIYS